jgi:hypothetical protein
MRQFKFECQVCLENKKEPKSQVRRIDEEPVCRTCTLDAIVPLFEKALRNELEFPPRWGSMELKIRDFQELLPAAFLRAWDDRMDEYDTPKPSRVYCEHMAFAPAAPGERNKLEVCGQFLGSSEESGQFQCPKCKSWSKDHRLHCYCGGVGKQDGNAKGPVLNEGTRGLEWQRCPDERCGVVVTLADGCNHMECTFCNAHFCYVCGNFAAPRSGHWRDAGPCPVYSKQNDPRDNGGAYDADGSTRMASTKTATTKTATIKTASRTTTTKAIMTTTAIAATNTKKMATMRMAFRNMMIALSLVTKLACNTKAGLTVSLASRSSCPVLMQALKINSSMMA